MIHKILVAVDSSPHAQAALALATDLARRYRAVLGLLYAFPHVSDLLGHPEYERLLELRTLAGNAVLDDARRVVGDGVPIETHVLEGPPAQAILRVAAEEGYGLIVVGSRGHGVMAGLLLGSVSNAVVQRALCPVLVVH
jgi:nucleotide-binding universal stress UspA family protein